MTESKPLAIPPIQKCALLLIALGVEKASLILKNLKDREVEKIAGEIAKMQNIPAEILNTVLEEYYQMIQTNQHATRGGVEYAKEVLEKTWGSKKAKEIVKRVKEPSESWGFDVLSNLDDKQLADLIQKEQPQTAALILAYLEPEHAAAVLSGLPKEIQYEIAYRLATMEQTSPALIEDIAKALKEQFGAFQEKDLHKVGGVKPMAEILNSAGRNSEKNILAYLKERDADLASEIINFMFTFQNIVSLDDFIIQTLMRKLDSKVVALALKGAGEELREKVFKNMTDRAGQMLKDELDDLGPVKLKDVEKAQREIVEILLRLEEAGEINLSRDDEDDDEIIE